MGGSWLGVLVVDDESAANILAGSSAAWEIDQAKYDGLKKKRETPGTAQGSVPSPTPRPSPQPMVASASPAGLPSSSSGDAASDAAAAAGAGTKLPPSVTLLTTSKQPPHEPVLELLTPKRRKAA